MKTLQFKMRKEKQVLFIWFNIHNLNYLQIAQFNVYVLIVNSAVPIFMSFYVGSWCDVIGRKFVIYICMVAKLFSIGFQLLCTIYMDWPKEWLLVATLLNSLGGKSLVFMTNLYNNND